MKKTFDNTTENFIKKLSSSLKFGYLNNCKTNLNFIYMKKLYNTSRDREDITSKASYPQTFSSILAFE